MTRRAGSMVLAVLIALVLSAPDAAHATSFIVSSTGDQGDKTPGDGLCETQDGPCTLRAAITEANQTVAADEITFAILGPGVPKIAPTSQLPPVVQPTTIDASQPGVSAPPGVELSGENLGGAIGVRGLELYGNSTVRGLVVNRWYYGIYLAGPNCTVTGSYVGTTADGTGAAPNEVGVSVASANAVIGGTGAGDGNVISGNGDTTVDGEFGNGGAGLEIYGALATNTQVLGNLIGTSADGEHRLSNGDGGIAISTLVNGGTPDGVDIGDGTAAGSNVIAGNGASGIYDLDAPNVRVRGNTIGLTRSGLAVDSDGSWMGQQFGITIEAGKDAVIGGDTAGERNVISNNAVDGVRFLGPGADNGIVRGNYLGTTLDGEKPFDVNNAVTGNRRFGVILLGRTGSPVGPKAARIGGTAAGQGNVISGNAFGVGLAVLSSDSIVEGNMIGVDKDGTDGVGNANEGVSIQLSPGNRIGGTAAGARNVISANAVGVIIIGNTARDNRVEGNVIGLAKDVSTSMGNTYHGVTMGLSAGENVIGYGKAATPAADCPAASACNTIESNGLAGVTVQEDAAFNTIRGNRISRNGGLGIDLITDKPHTPNDPGDADTGPNDLLNFPVAVSEYVDPDVRVADGVHTRAISGVVDAPDLSKVTVDLYGGPLNDVKDGPDDSGFGEGLDYVRTLKQCVGAARFDCILKDGSFVVKDPPTPKGYYSATATDDKGNTSEFGPVCRDSLNKGKTDSDLDGLCDDWETKGLDYDGDGAADLALNSAPFAAKADRKDLFVELDYMATNAHAHYPQAAALSRVRDAFDKAPVDGKGIALHFTPGRPAGVDERLSEVASLHFTERGAGADDDLLDVRNGAAGYQPTAGQPCDGRLGTKAMRDAVATCATRLGAWNTVFRYGLFAHEYVQDDGTGTGTFVDSGSSGVADLEGGDDFLVTLAPWGPANFVADGGGAANCGTVANCRAEVQAGTLMHEYGHTLGLGHGGHNPYDDNANGNANYKPNYLSIMSYAYQFRRFDLTRPLSYSSWRLPDLDETALDEGKGLDGDSVFAGMNKWKAVWTAHHAASNTCRFYTGAAVGDVNFNRIGGITSPVGMGINDPDDSSLAAGQACQVAVRRTTLQSFDDWSNLFLSHRARVGLGQAGGAMNIPPQQEELTAEEGRAAAELADNDADGIANPDDNCADTANANQADTDGDGVGDACEPPGAPLESEPPAITGQTRDGATLTATDGVWVSETQPTFARQWKRCDALGNACVTIPGANGSTYVLTPADVDRRLRVTVTATNAAGDASATSAATEEIDAVAPFNTTAPVVTGAPINGGQLSASPGGWTGTPTIAYAYQWRRCDAGGGGCQSIPGATGSTYPMTVDDVGSRLLVRVSATNVVGTEGPAESALTAKVVGASPEVATPPTVTGTARDGRTLTGTDGTWTGDGPMTFTYQWKRCNAVGAACVDVPGATAQTLVLGQDDVGHTMRLQVTATNDVGSADGLSDATAQVLGRLPVNQAPPALSGTARVGETLTVTTGQWDGTAPIAFAYGWLRCDGAGGACQPVPGASGTTLALTDADAGSRIRAAVTASNSGGVSQVQSAPSTIVEPAAGGPGPTPTPTPGGTPSPSPSPGPLDPNGPGGLQDTSAPSITVQVARKAVLATVRRAGLPIRVGCSEACTATASLVASKAVARKLKLGRRAVTVGTAKVDLDGSAAKPLKVKLTKKAKRRLARVRTVRLQLQVKASDPAGNAASVARAVTLGRKKKGRAAAAAGVPVTTPPGQRRLPAAAMRSSLAGADVGATAARVVRRP